MQYLNAFQTYPNLYLLIPEHVNQGEQITLIITSGLILALPSSIIHELCQSMKDNQETD